MSKLKSCRIRAEGDKVLISLDGKASLIPWQQALEMARGIYTKAKQAEEFAMRNRIIADHALLTRVGAPIGLSNNSQIQDAVRQAAAWDRDLRRALPGGVKSQSVVGVPAVHVKPPVQRIAPSGVAGAEGFGRIGGR